MQDLSAFIIGIASARWLMLFLGKRALWSGLGHEGTARMLGAIDGSRGSYASGLRAYGAFCDLVGVTPFPATSDSLIRFVALFSNPATAEQYVKHVKFAHHFAGHDISGFDKRLDYVVKGSSKSSTISKRQAPAICWKRTRALMRAAFADGRPRDAAAYGLSSLFLLRVKNELLPLQWRALDSGGHSSITFQTSRKGRLVAVIDLRSRKNARHGARLERICTCATSPDEILCPVHLLLGLQDLPHLLDGRLFDRSYEEFLRTLRRDAEICGFDDAKLLASHGFRRGSAREYYDRTGSLGAILIAGGWRSSAYLTYLQTEKLDADNLFDALEAGDEEADDPPEPPSVRAPARPTSRPASQPSLLAFGFRPQ